MKKALFLAWSVFLALLWLCPAWAEDADPVVVRVGDISFPRSRLQSAVDINLSLSEMMSREAPTDEEARRQREDVVDRFIREGLIEMKLRAAGRDDFTEEELETLRDAAMNQYDALWQGIWDRAQQTGEDFTEVQVTEFLEEQGYTTGAILESLKSAERLYRAVELYCPEVTLTEGMVEKYYETQFLWPDRDRYENDLELYEREVLALNNESFYTPEGYRAIRQILLDYPDAVTKGLRDDTAHVNRAGQAVAEAIQRVTEAALTGDSWDDIAGPRADYDAAAQTLEAARKEYTDRRRALTLPLIRDTVDEIRAAFDAGIDFSSLIDKYSADRSEQNVDRGGYPVHPDSPNWPEEFLQAVRALQKPGELSGPVLSDMGVHILYYASDIPAGAHELTASERSALESSALYYYKSLELEKLLEDWRSEYEIETHPELLEG